jgi:hypothetical protein
LRQKLPHAGEFLEKLGIVRIDRKVGKSFLTAAALPPGRPVLDQAAAPTSFHSRETARFTTTECKGAGRGGLF